jgi:hypothetical protein
LYAIVVTVASGSSPGRKLIAYGIFSKENEDFQQWAIARVKKEIDSIAAQDSESIAAQDLESIVAQDSKSIV